MLRLTAKTLELPERDIEFSIDEMTSPAMGRNDDVVYVSPGVAMIPVILSSIQPATPPPAQAQVVTVAKIPGLDAYNVSGRDAAGIPIADLSGDYIPANAAPQQQADGRDITGLLKALLKYAEVFHGKGDKYDCETCKAVTETRALLKELAGEK